MEDLEVPTEHLQETLHEGAHGGPPWASGAALSSALIAVLAAVSALLAGHHANEAMIDQMRATDNWSFYQAKGIKAAVLKTKDETLVALGKPTSAEDLQHAAQYEKDQEQIQDKAKEEEHASAEHLERHNALARVVTLYQVGIAMAAISVLGRRKWLWFFSLALGATASTLFILALR